MRNSKKLMSVLLSASIVLSSGPAINVEAAGEANYLVNMKISYHDFYAAYGTDTMKGVTNSSYVDAVTSATINKAKMNGAGELSAGTYYTEAADGSAVYINGVVFPVIVSEAEKEELIKDGNYAEADFSEVDMASYTGNYLNYESVDGKASYAAADMAKVKLANVKAEFTTNTKYGDYQIDLSGEDIESHMSTGNDTVYGVIVNTKENGSYPMYTLENIWRNTEIAWSAGFVTETHGCPLRSDIYRNMMGETIKDITYITDKGIYEVDVEDIYVPKKTDNSVTVDTVQAKDTTEITAKLNKMPDSFVPVVSLSGNEAVITQQSSETNADGTVDYVYLIKADNIVPDTYTITASDSSKEYADVTASVTVKGAQVIFDNTKLTLKDPACGDSIANFVSKISKVDVTKPNGESVTYLPKIGKGSAIVAVLFDENGNLDMNATYESIKKSGGHGNSTSEVIESGSVFADKGVYTVSVTTSVYDIVTFNVSTEETDKPDADEPEVTVKNPAKVTVKSAKNSSGKAVVVKWNKVEDADGYEIKYVTGSKSKIVKATALSKKITGLKKGKTYKISVRAYKTVDGKKYTSKWSKTLKVKVTK